MTDASLIVTRLSTLTEDASGLTFLETLVKAKALPRKPVGQAMRGLINRVNSGGTPKDLSRESSPVDTKAAPAGPPVEDSTKAETNERKSDESEDLPSTQSPNASAATKVPGEQSTDPIANGTVGEGTKEEEGPLAVSSPALPMINGDKSDEVVPGSEVPKIDSADSVTAPTDGNVPSESTPTGDKDGAVVATSVEPLFEAPDLPDMPNGTALPAIETSSLELVGAEKEDQEVAPPLPPDKE